MPTIPMYDGAQIMQAIPWASAVAALGTALAAGLDPEAEPPRTSTPFGAGELLSMPASGGAIAGVKLVTVAPGNASLGLPRIHGIYALFDATTLCPLAVLDGAALTSIRTPAVSALGVDLVAPREGGHLVVFGSGPQAVGHVHALSAVRPVSRVTVVGRDVDHTNEFIRQLAVAGIEVTAGTADAVIEADLVACCTTARTPLFDGRLLPDHAVVVAVGSHEPGAREVDTETVRRCGALVEARGAATAEAGDVILAIREGAIATSGLVTFAELIGHQTDAQPRLVKTVGMGWQDLVLAGAVVQALSD